MHSVHEQVCIVCTYVYVCLHVCVMCVCAHVFCTVFVLVYFGMCDRKHQLLYANH